MWCHDSPQMMPLCTSPYCINFPLLSIRLRINQDQVNFLISPLVSLKITPGSYIIVFVFLGISTLSLFPLWYDTQHTAWKFRVSVVPTYMAAAYAP